MSETLKNKYQVCEEIGRGRFGTISRVFCPITQASFACKSIDKRLLTDPTDRECLENEPKIMTLLSPHSNIVQIHDMFESEDTLQLILELCQPYTLYDQILQPGLSESKAASYVQQITSGLAHCHRFGIVHRDIKPDNIFFDFRVSAEAKDLLRKMICRDVSKRLSAEQVLRHPWILNGGETTSMD
ncbi:Protein kinase domain - like 10 [Theobroma cacao]|nr:Protein kinase domain - like 10 [Theobroma cacao]